MKKALLLSVTLSLNFTSTYSLETEDHPQQESQATREEAINWIKTCRYQSKGWDISSGIIHLYGMEPNPDARYCRDPWPSTLQHLSEMERYLPILNPHTVIYEKAYHKSGVPVLLINWALTTGNRKLDLPLDGIYDYSGEETYFLGRQELNNRIENHPNKINIIWSKRRELGKDSDSETSDDES